MKKEFILPYWNMFEDCIGIELSPSNSLHSQDPKQINQNHTKLGNLFAF